MKHKIIADGKCLALFIFLLAGSACKAQANLPGSFDNLLSLAGTWSMKTDKGTLFESWEKTNDSTLTGKSFMVNNADTVLLERMTLKKMENNIFYIPVTANQNNQQPVIFTLVKADSTYTFENKAHDFPQRIIYELPKDRKLHAWIEGNVDGELKRSDYNYEAVP